MDPPPGLIGNYYTACPTHSLDTVQGTTDRSPSRGTCEILSIMEGRAGSVAPWGSPEGT
jgi:hypothetical protein